MYQFCEHAMVGFAAAHLLVTGYNNVLGMAVRPLLAGEFIWIIPILSGLALYCRFFKSLAWVARIPLSFLIGAGTAMSVFRSLGNEFVQQIAATCELSWSSPNNVIYILAVLFSLAYFVVSVSDKSPVGKGLVKVGKLGQGLMMMGFGAALAGTIVGTLSYLISRLNFLFGTWLGLVK